MANNTVKKRGHVLYPSERMREMVTAIQIEKGLNNMSDVYYLAVGDLYHKLFPVYATKRGIGPATQDPAEIARQRVAISGAEQRERERIDFELKTSICEGQLHGTVEQGPDGPVCVFNTYNFDEADEQRVPLEMVTYDFVKHQKVK